MFHSFVPLFRFSFFDKSYSPTMSEWSHSLFGCLEEPKMCVISWCCAPCQLSYQRAAVKGTECGPTDLIMVWCCPLCFACPIRCDIREKYGLAGSSMSDCCVMYFCGICSIVQQHRQLIAKGDKPQGCLMD